MATLKEIFADYNDVIVWLDNLKITDPLLAEEIISSNISMAAGAFSKPFHSIDSLAHRSNFSKMTEDEIKIMLFYLHLCRKRMR
jgi:hypothetical protein